MSASNTIAETATQRRRYPLIFLAMCNFLVTFDITAVVVAMPTIRSELDLSVSGFAWVMDAYSLAFVVLLTTAGAVADRYGRRRTLLFGMAVFLIGSLGCASALNAIGLWISRSVQGVGAAFTICGALALLSTLYSERSERIKAFAVAGSVSGAAMALGPSIGGVLTESFGWRWVFWINLFLVAIIVVGTFLTIERDTLSDSQKTTPFDVIGVVTLTAFLAITIWVLLHGGEIAGITFHPWVTFAAPLLALALFVWSQIAQTHPAYRLDVFRSRGFVGMCFVPFGLSIGYWSLLVYLPLFMTDALGLSTGWTSGFMLAVTLPMVILPFIGSKFAQRVSERTFFGLGVLVLAFGCGLIALGAAAETLLLVVIGMIVAGTSTALVNAQVSGAIVAFVPSERAGTASAIATTLRQGGFALGIALLGATLGRAEARETTVLGAASFVPLFMTAAIGTTLCAIMLIVLVRKDPRPVPN